MSRKTLSEYRRIGIRGTKTTDEAFAAALALRELVQHLVDEGADEHSPLWLTDLLFSTVIGPPHIDTEPPDLTPAQRVQIAAYERTP